MQIPDYFDKNDDVFKILNFFPKGMRMNSEIR